jgi:MYXO-CTERM domain-containing protein
MKFFVAKVDPAKVKFVDGRAALSPLRFHYDSEDFQLPIRLGLANSSGTQDLIVDILAPNKRFEVANYKNVFIPTNIDVAEGVKAKFGAFYAALFDRTIEKNPGAVVTEYAWQATTCDPCPGPALDQSDFATLGADVLSGDAAKPTSYGNADFVLTRLHARYGRDMTDDLHFKDAQPVVGGRELLREGGKLEEGARPDGTNNFQGRYAIRHEWTGKMTCSDPIRHRWGGPPNGFQTGTIAATDLAFAPRGEVTLQSVVQRDVPEIDLKADALHAEAPVNASGSAMAPSTSPATTPTKKTKSGCGCATTDRNGASSVALLVGALLLARRKRHHARS